MKFDDCLQAAIDGGTLDPDLGRQAQNRYRARVAELEGRGLPNAAAHAQAAGDVAETITRSLKSRRHATLHQLRILQRNEARYPLAAVNDPDRILKDIELVQAEQFYLERSFMANIHDFLANFRTDVLGRVRKRALLREVTQELHGEDSGSVNAKAIAQAVLAAYERARSLANAYGMDIAKLHDWGIRHTHHKRKILEAGYDKWFKALYDDRALDWSRIVDFKTGKPFAVTKGARPLRADADEFLKPIFDSITRGGWDDRIPSMTIGGRSLGNSRQDSRILHFASTDAWMKYNDDFGMENPFEAIVGHFRGMARDIALIRNFGPNPKLGLSHALQVIEKGAQTDTTLTGKPRSRMIDRNSRKAKKARVMLRTITGENNVPASHFAASFLAGTRNLLVAAQLGSAPLSSVTDWASMRLAARAVGLNPNKHTQGQIVQLVKGFSPQQAKDMGFILDTWFDTGATMARFMGDVWAPEITSRITNSVLRLNGLAFLTDRAKIAAQAAFGSDMADLAHLPFDQLDERLRNFMISRRITAADWDALRAEEAIYIDPTGGRHINPHWFAEHTSLDRAAADDIAIRWGALVEAHKEFAIPSASLRGRSTILGDAPPGSFSGEVGRSTLMYKSFSLSQLFGQIRRVAEIGGGPGTKALYAANYVMMMTLFGAFAMQLKEVAKGRDPQPMETPSFWGKALLQGGGVGIFGDFFTSTTSRAGGGLAETLAGPVVGVAGDLSRAVNSNIARAAEGKDLLIGRDVVNLARRYNPLATFQPPIPVPTRLALDRMIWDQLQLLVDPEAPDQFRREAQKMKRETGTQSWWRKGVPYPDRAPDLSNALGGRP